MKKAGLFVSSLLITMVVLSPLLLTGCGQTLKGDLVRGAIKERGATAADSMLINAEWTLCNAATAGAVRRAYGNNPVKAHAYRTFCNRSSTENVIFPPLSSKAESEKVVEAAGASSVSAASISEGISE